MRRFTRCWRTLARSGSAGPDGSASVAVDTTPVGPGTKVPTLGAFASHTAAIKVVAARPTLSQLQQRVASDYLGMRPNRARHYSLRSERDCDHERKPASDGDFSNHSLLHIIVSSIFSPLMNSVTTRIYLNRERSPRTD